VDKSRLEIRPGVWLDHRRAVFLEREGVLAVADLHLGYAWAHRFGGQMMPLQPDDVRERLLELCSVYEPRVIAILGDIVHRAVPVKEIKDEFFSLLDSLVENCRVKLILGNHDKGLEKLVRGGKSSAREEHPSDGKPPLTLALSPPRGEGGENDLPPNASGKSKSSETSPETFRPEFSNCDRPSAPSPLGGERAGVRGGASAPQSRPTFPPDAEFHDTFQIDRFLFVHGNENIAVADGSTILMGHEHPAISLGDGVRSAKFPCFLASEKLIVLPAFSRWAAGTEIRSQSFMSPLARNAAFEKAIAILNGKLLQIPLL
jgi:metallophosphoesterase superfamily enzyme